MAEDLAFGWWAEDEAADDASEWNTAQVGEDFLPGFIEVSGLDAKREIEHKHAKGEDGETFADNGNAGREFRIIVTLPGKPEWIHWCRIYPKLDPRKKGAARTARPILHPLVNMMGIQTIYVTNIEPDWPDAQGGMKWTISCTEWMPKPKKKTKAKMTPKLSSASSAFQQTTTDADYRNALLRDRGPVG